MTTSSPKETTDKKRVRSVRFTRRELLEVIRAIDLISQEDASCRVNMDAISVRAKRSAYDKCVDVLKRTR